MAETNPPDEASRTAAHAQLTRRVRQVADAAGRFIEYWGFKAVHGRVWTLLALSWRPLSQTELCELLDVSRSLMSKTMTELQTYGLVRAVSDHRNAPYEAVLDVWPTIADVLRRREWMMIEESRLALEAAIEEADLVGESGEVPWDASRMRMLLNMTELAQSLLKILISMRVQSLDAVQGWAKGVKRFLGTVAAWVPGKK